MKMTDRDLILFPKEIDAWSARQKWRNPFAGLAWFRRDSGGGLNIVSRHWPHHLCWSWIVAWRWPDAGKSGEHHRWKISRYVHNGGGWLAAGPIWITWQDFHWMVALGRRQEAMRFVKDRIALIEAAS